MMSNAALPNSFWREVKPFVFPSDVLSQAETILSDSFKVYQDYQNQQTARIKERELASEKEFIKSFFLQVLPEEYLSCFDLKNSAYTKEALGEFVTFPCYLGGSHLVIEKNNTAFKMFFFSHFESFGTVEIFNKQDLQRELGKMVNKIVFHTTIAESIDDYSRNYLPVNKFSVVVYKIHFTSGSHEYSFYSIEPYVFSPEQTQINIKAVDETTYHLSYDNYPWFESIVLTSLEDCKKLGLTETIDYEIHGIAIEKGFYVSKTEVRNSIAIEVPLLAIRKLIKGASSEYSCSK